MSKEYKSWDSKGTAAKQLIEQFELFDKTDGAAGINHNLNKPKDIISEIYNICPFLQSYNPSYFSNNFRKLRNNWKTSKAKSKGRKEKKVQQNQQQTGMYLHFHSSCSLFTASHCSSF